MFLEMRNNRWMKLETYAYLDECWQSSKQFYSQIIGDEQRLSFEITHNLNTQDVWVQIRDLETGGNIDATVKRIGYKFCRELWVFETAPTKQCR